MTTALARESTQQPTDAEILQRILDRPVQSAGNLRRLISAKWKQIGAMLPKHMTETRFAALVMGAASNDSNVYGCTGESILKAIFQAASLGLEINAATGEAYIIPYKTTATLVPGYKGLIKLAIRSGDVLLIEPRLVYKGELFTVRYGTTSEIVHAPDFDVDRSPENVVADATSKRTRSASPASAARLRAESMEP